MTTPPIFIPSLAHAQRAIEIATQARIGVYDCVYVAVSESLNCELLTADEKLAKNLPNFKIKLLSTF
jgi:predicted nucleic acid-binding protein